LVYGTLGTAPSTTRETVWLRPTPAGPTHCTTNEGVTMTQGMDPNGPSTPLCSDSVTVAGATHGAEHAARQGNAGQQGWLWRDTAWVTHHYGAQGIQGAIAHGTHIVRHARCQVRQLHTATAGKRAAARADTTATTVPPRTEEPCGVARPTKKILVLVFPP
jgi:hypothetical protein